MSYTIGSAIDAFIRMLQNDPGLWMIGGFTILGFLFVLTFSCLVFWGIIKRIWCLAKGSHRWYAYQACFRCEKTAELYAQDSKQEQNVV